MLRRPGGATLSAIMQVTDWQRHSVRGFLAAVIKKRLKLDLMSEKIDGKRTYRLEESEET